MLILTRRVGETIRIGHDIFIKHLGHRGGASRIGIIAPKTVSVDRQEIYEKKFKVTDLSSESNANLILVFEPKAQLKEQPKVTVKKNEQQKLDKFYFKGD